MEEASRPAPGFSLSLRAKIILAFCILSIAVSAALGLSSYWILDRNLFQELRSRVRDLTDIGALTLDHEALGRLAGRLAEGVSEEQAAEIQAGGDFRRISDSLNRIRAVEPQLARFIYTFVPTEDPDKALFLVDGDVLLVGSARPSGEPVEEDSISPLGSEFDISAFPVARQAIAEKRSLVESEYTYDEDFLVHSVSGYAPILAADGRLLAVLGLDMVNTDVRAILNRTTLLSLATAGVALLLAIGTSVVFGTGFTRGIISLDKVMRRFDERNMDVRAQVRSRDEVGRLGLSFNQMAGMIQRYSDQTRATLQAYGRFVPHEFLFFLGKQHITEVTLGDSVQKEMTILFSDIRSFASLSESMSPEENFKFLNAYLSRIGPAIRENNGFIDKYIGDAIMALFPEKPDDAVRAALAMRAKLVEYNGHRASAGYGPIQVGIAINTGKLMMGTLGEQERMDGTVISDAVNLASRLEGLSRLYGDTVLITGPTLSLLEGRRDFHTRFVDRVRVRGRREAVLIYEVFDWESPERIQLRQKLKAQWSEATNRYYGRDFLPAFRLLRALYEKDPADRIAELYLRRAAALLKRGVPRNWEGVELIEAK
jgi:class 3 adenylate cyclase/HAMP domain-containing protein